MLAVFLTLGPFVGRSVAADPVLDFTGGTERFSAIDATYGWKFTVAQGSTITIEGLGVFDVGANGLANSHQVGLWDSGGSLLTSVTITNANSTHVASTSKAGDWLSTPITSRQLTSGDYVVGALYVKNDADHFMAGATAKTISGVTFDEARNIPGTGLLFPSMIPPGEENANAGYFGPNLFTATPPVPEPTSLILLGSGLAGLAGRFAWRKRRPKQGEKPSAV